MRHVLRMIFISLLCFYLFLETSVQTKKAMAEENVQREVVVPEPRIEPAASDRRVVVQNDDYSAQAVLSSGDAVVISAPIDGIIKASKFESGDKFKKGDVLIEYDCSAEKAKVREVKAKLSVSKRQLEAYERLKKNDVVSEIEYVSVLGSYKQDKEVYNQANTRLSMCKVRAPFDGRVQNKMISNHEVVKSGRLLMEVSSSDPLNVELLVPSIWLRWVNIGTPLELYIRESDRLYDANVMRIHGEVDPVSQTVRLVAKINGYKEELLPGMSGRATFDKKSRAIGKGFMGLSMEMEQ